MKQHHAQLSRSGHAPLTARALMNLLSQLRGQMLRTRIEPQLFIFRSERTIRIHTFFVCAPLDIAFIDAHRRITRLITLAPNRIACGHGKYLLEMSAHTCPYTIGDTITINYDTPSS